MRAGDGMWRFGSLFALTVSILACAGSCRPDPGDTGDTGAIVGGGTWTPGYGGLTRRGSSDLELATCGETRTVRIVVDLSDECLSDPVPYAWGWPTGDFTLAYEMSAPAIDTADSGDSGDSGGDTGTRSPCDGTRQGAKVTLTVTGPDGTVLTSDGRTLDPGDDPVGASFEQGSAWRNCAENEPCEVTYTVEATLDDGDAATVHLDAEAIVRACSSGDPTTDSMTMYIDDGQ